jgi:hypothetical protein
MKMYGQKCMATKNTPTDVVENTWGKGLRMDWVRAAHVSTNTQHAQKPAIENFPCAGITGDGFRWQTTRSTPAARPQAAPDLRPSPTYSAALASVGALARRSGAGERRVSGHLIGRCRH